MFQRVIAGLLGVWLCVACGSTTTPDGASGSTTTSAPSSSSTTTSDDPAGSTTTSAPVPESTTTTDQDSSSGGDAEGEDCEPTGPQETRTVETREVPVSDDLSPIVKYPILVLRGLQLCEGQPQVFSGGHAATVSINMLEGVDIRCTLVGDPGDPGEQSLRRSVFSTRNHGGTGTRRLGVRWLFTPDRSGTYDCELRGWGKTPRGVAGTLSIVDDDATVLSVSAVEPGAMEWREPNDAYLCNDEPADPACDRSAVVLYQEFTTDDTAQSIDVYAGVEASICASGYEACSSGTAGVGDFAIRTRLIATQLATPGTRTMCDGAEPHVTDLTTPVPGAGRLNHTKIHLEMDHPVPIVGGSGCSRTFAIRVLVDYVLTNPEGPNHGGLVEGLIPDGDPANPEALNRSYTSAMALNNF